MTDTGYTCPVEGCDKHREEWTDDRPPFDSKKGVLSHINALGDGPHKKARNDRLWKQAPEATVSQPEGDESPDDGDSNEATDSDDEAAQSDDQGDDEADSDASNGDSEADVVSQDEYEAQQSRQNGSSNDDDQANTGDSGGDTGGASSGLPTPSLPNVSPMWTVVIIAAVFAAIVLWRVHRAKSSAPAVEPQEESESNPDEVALFEQ